MFASFRSRQSRRRTAASPRRRLLLEELESRTLLSLTPLDTLAAAVAPAASLAPDARGSGSTTVSGPYQPSQIRTAYGFDRISFLTSNGTPSSSVYNSTAGAAQTIALVDAYNDPNIQSDLATFDTQFGLPGTNTTSVSQFLSIVGIDSVTGNVVAPSTLATNSNWAGEISLDVEWAHAIAPAAKILLVESSAGNQVSDMMNAVNYASAHSNIVSMSWGSPESVVGSSAELADDASFKKAGVTFIASAGDSGLPAYYPSASPNVVSVGGTHLVLNTNSTINSETVWGSGVFTPFFGGSGGGYSSVESEPGYQSSYASSSYVQTTLNNKVLLNTKRGTPDVAYDADPNTGFYIYDTVPIQGQTGWFEAGGTSAGAPQWGAFVAIADQARAAQGVPPGPLSSAGVLSALYTAASSSSTYPTDFNDITKGSNGASAVPGYDLATGLGSPKANALISALSNALNPLALAAPVTAPSTTTKTGGNKPHTIVQPTTDTSSSVLADITSPATQVLGTMSHPLAGQLLAVPTTPVLSQLLTSSPTSTSAVIPTPTTATTAAAGAATFNTFTGTLPQSTSLDSTHSAGGGSDSSLPDGAPGVPTDSGPIPDFGGDWIDPVPVAPGGWRVEGAVPSAWIGPGGACFINEATITTLVRESRASTPLPVAEPTADRNAGVTLVALFAALGTCRLDRSAETDGDGRRKLLPPGGW
jgi:hypothetical protein